MKIVQAFKSEGSNLSDSQYAQYHPEFTKLAKSKGPSGIVTARDIVQAAKSEKSAFHSYIYKDDDAQAAYKYRLSLAREIVQSFMVEWVDDDGALNVGREFTAVLVTVNEETESGFIATRRAAASGNIIADQIRRMTADIRAIERRYTPFLQSNEHRLVLVKLRELLSQLENKPRTKKAA